MHTIINTLRGRFVHGKDESEYYESIIKNVHTGMDHTFCFSVCNTELPEIPPGTIVFSTSDEHHRQPIPNHLQENVGILLKTFFPKEGVTDHRVLPFPLGYFTDFGGHALTPIAERGLDYSFYGAHNDNGRDKLHGWLRKRKGDGCKKEWGFYEGWGKGKGMWDYGSLLTKTKIALCPPGYVSPECARLPEAARCGCVLLVPNDLPTHLWYFQGFPGIKIEDWSDLKIVDELLADPKRMQDISDETVKWYNRCIDPKAVGAWLTERIKERIQKA